MKLKIEGNYELIITNYHNGFELTNSTTISIVNNCLINGTMKLNMKKRIIYNIKNPDHPLYGVKLKAITALKQTFIS
jgi:hypothetical protein